MEDYTAEASRAYLFGPVNTCLEEISNAIEKTYGIKFFIQPLGTKEINDWHKTAYACLAQTMVFKDDVGDIEKGIGFIYNVINKNTMLVATLGTSYIGTLAQSALSNTTIYYKLDEIPIIKEQEIKKIFSALAFYIVTKYKLYGTSNVARDITNLCMKIYNEKPF